MRLLLKLARPHIVLLLGFASFLMFIFSIIVVFREQLSYHPSINWSPDGERLAFGATIDNGDTDLFVIDADGRNPRLIATNLNGNMSAIWSDDGETLYILSHDAWYSDARWYRVDLTQKLNAPDYNQRETVFYPLATDIEVENLIVRGAEADNFYAESVCNNPIYTNYTDFPPIDECDHTLEVRSTQTDRIIWKFTPSDYDRVRYGTLGMIAKVMQSLSIVGLITTVILFFVMIGRVCWKVFTFFGNRLNPRKPKQKRDMLE